MAWKMGSGLGALLKGYLTNSSFQSAAIGTISSIGQRGLELLKGDIQPEKLKTLFSNLIENPKAIVGNMVKGTEAEKHVDETVVKAAEEIKA